MFESPILNLTMELLLGFVGLLIAVKIIGKRQVHQVSPFDFVSAVVLGELLGNAIYNDETNIFHIFYALALWTALLFLIEKISQKSSKFRVLVEGTPKLIIKKGMIDYDVLKKERLDFYELLSLLRDKDAFSVREVEYAIIEPSGIVTVIKKPSYSTVTKRDLNAKLEAVSLTLPLILEGQIQEENLKATGHNQNWLVKSIKEENIKSIKNVLYAEWSKEDGFFIQKKKD